ncbi:MAG TPA: CCA tRNA nucleotidyltransferase [Candidatus Paceibacterota bacterium]|nr:CCA tRNA nucleotidyltransferase [Candidatus Paceibacterota bacterium]HMP19015.1 CCA tRNA nucleotidyltransferase [Candidatus Paceibacterota bacterium]HMP85545.1 CCA tRNA nucleotidyltransferase [Candidatus Paceibacterota bacterium]
MNSQIDTTKIPIEIKQIDSKLKSAGFESFIVGGCVRDLILNKKPKDWDITTNAKPEEILKIFENSFYENDYGTVGVKTDSEDQSLSVVEITPYRIESDYKDKRHPNTVIFSQKITDDLKRRDFTINSMAFNLDKGQIIDDYKGQNDLFNGLIRAVGDPDKRFREDALRMLRAIRFSAELGFIIEQKTAESIAQNAELIKYVSFERIGEEFKKIIMSKNPAMAIGIAQKLNIIKYIIPIFEDSVGCVQNKEAHKYDVWEHSLKTLQHSADKNFSLEIRLASLFHDVAKPKTKFEEGNKTTFYNHEVVGAKVTRETLKKMAFSKEIVDKVTLLVRHHMFFSDTEQITHSAVRRLIAKVGKDNIWDLINLRICDRIGSGRPKEEPYRLRKFQSMIEEVIRDPISVSMLKIDGNDLMKMFHMKPGPKIGLILHALLEEVLEDPAKNEKMFLVKHSEELLKLSDEELKKIGEKAKKTKEDKDLEEINTLRKKRFVK